MTGEVDLSDADAIFMGAHANEATGNGVPAGGDIDGDGAEDILIGAGGSLLGSSMGGAVFVLLGGQSLSSLLSRLGTVPRVG